MSKYIEFIQTIKGLPKEIQDIIGEYNIVHRPLMANVLEEMKHRYFPKQTSEYWRCIYRASLEIISNISYCENCNATIISDETINSFCSSYCCDEAIYRYEEEYENIYTREDDIW